MMTDRAWSLLLIAVVLLVAAQIFAMSWKGWAFAAVTYASLRLWDRLKPHREMYPDEIELEDPKMSLT